MRDRPRLILFFVSATIFFGVFCRAAWNMPSWGFYGGPYGDVLAAVSVFERHSNDVVNSINYDYRAFDTLGEEFILFTAVLGVLLLLRREATSPSSPSARVRTEAARPALSRTVQVIMVPAVLLTSVFGLYLSLHGQLSPGGGFAGGVVLATAALLLYIAINPIAFRRLASHTATEVIEAAGAGSYALIGLLPLTTGKPLLTNILPLGQTGDPISSGTIALISACVGIEVTAAFLLVSYTYLQEILEEGTPE